MNTGLVTAAMALARPRLAAPNGAGDDGRSVPC
jgi:hypothetical protein